MAQIERDKTIKICAHATNAEYCLLRKEKCHYRCKCELYKTCKYYKESEV